MAIRENEVAASAMGVNPGRYKLQAFVISAISAGMAGSLFAHVTGYLNPNSFTFQESVALLLMGVVGAGGPGGGGAGPRPPRSLGPPGRRREGGRRGAAFGAGGPERRRGGGAAGGPRPDAAIRRPGGRGRRRSHRGAGNGVGAHRPQRGRQDDALQHADGYAPSLRRAGRVPGGGGPGSPAPRERPARHPADLPEPPALPPDARVGEHRR